MSCHPAAEPSATTCDMSYGLIDEEITSTPVVYTPVLRPTHFSTSYAGSACSSNSDVSPFFYEGIWLEGPDAPQDASTEQTPLLSAADTFDMELDGFQVNTTEALSLKSGDLESGSLIQTEIAGVGTRLSSIVGRLWRWVLRILQCCGLVAKPGAVGEEGED